MLSADSSALKNESDDQMRPIPPMIPSVAALFWTRCPSVIMLSSDVPGNACLSSRTKKSDASARCARPNSDSARKMSGTKERSAKYATIAARCVPRSAKNLRTSWRRRIVTGESSLIASTAMEAGRALADLVEISPQIEAAAIVAGDGALAGSVGISEGRAGALTRAVRELLERAAFRSDRSRVTQLHASLGDGEVFAVTEARGRTIVAVASERAVPGLVFYDLKRCLAAAEGEDGVGT